MQIELVVTEVEPSLAARVEGVETIYGLYLELDGITLSAMDAMQERPAECVVVSLDADGSSCCTGIGINAHTAEAARVLQAHDDQLADGIHRNRPNGAIVIQNEPDVVSAVAEADPSQNTVYIVHPHATRSQNGARQGRARRGAPLNL